MGPQLAVIKLKNTWDCCAPNLIFRPRVLELDTRSMSKAKQLLQTQFQKP
jgi:hypothetical protein